MGIDEDKRATLRRFAAVGAASPLVGLAEASGGESEVRGAIGGYLTTTPGAHFSKLRDDLKLGTGESQHHLRRLLEDGVVESYRDGDYRRFYPAGEFSDFQKVVLGYLRRATPSAMLVALLRNPDATGGDLAEAADVSRGTISKYAAELENVGLLSREDGYALTRPETVLTLVLRYADSFGPGAAALAREADSLIRYDP